MRTDTTERSTVDADVIVVGARVAGATTALHLAQRGHRVIVVDRARFPSDTLSTHAIARTGMVQLQKLGLTEELHRRGTPQVRRVSFHRGGDVVERDLRPSAGVDHLLAPRRHVLDPVVLEAAEAAGAEVFTGRKVTDVVWEKGRAVGIEMQSAGGAPVTLRAHHVVGADGLGSTVARRVGAKVRLAGPSTAATHYTYARGLDGEGFEYHMATGSMVGMFRTNDDEVRHDKPIARLRTTVSDGLGRTVLEGEAVVYRDPAVAAATAGRNSSQRSELVPSGSAPT